MFFVISKLFAPLTVPLTYIMLGMLTALVFYRNPRIVRISLISAIVLLFVFGTPFLPTMLTRRLENAYEIPKSPPHVDAVIVLAGMLNMHESSFDRLEFYDSVERILTGMQLVRQGIGDILLISGGSGSLHDQTKRESIFLRQFAIDFGIPEEQILIDPDSRNTYENAVNTNELMQQHELTTSILVTSASHMPRSMRCFQKVGLQPIPYPVDFVAAAERTFHFSDLVPNIGDLRHTTRVFHEYVGLLMYSFAGYI